MASSQSRELRLLVQLFVLWKALLLLVACASPGPGYDTSTKVLFSAISTTGGANDELPVWLTYLPSKLVRWDAFYFVPIAQRGYVHEQEWAFGWGFSKLISLVAALNQDPAKTLFKESWAAIIISNLSHLLSILVLYRLARTLQQAPRHANFPFVVSSLHIIAPGGIFLSAPYGESLFSFLNFSGIWLYCMSRQISNGSSPRRLKHDLLLLTSGILFALAATVRSNAILNGIIFAYDVVELLPRLPVLLTNLYGLRYLTSLASAGIVLAFGYALPQYIAYSEYCTGDAMAPEIRPWCTKIPPSIYTFVQDQYWNVGFLRYWTLSNVPLFALAVPMLSIMIYSGLHAISVSPMQHPKKTPAQRIGHADDNAFVVSCIKRIAMPQVLLAVLALTTFHVQIITRIASGYPLPYLWLAGLLLRNPGQAKSPWAPGIAQTTVRWMVIYALVQGGLFASFLPPA